MAWTLVWFSIMIMYEAANAVGYPTSDIGIYLQPVVQGVGCHCEFNLTCGPNNRGEVEKVRNLFTSASEALVRNGAYFSRPYGSWAEMVYSRDGEGLIGLRKMKGIFDPNNIMNPGKLCL